MNKIGDAGACALADALFVNQSLDWLTLKSNVIGRPGLQRLLACAEVNSTLTHIETSGIKAPIGPRLTQLDNEATAEEDWQKMMLALHVNYVGQREHQEAATSLRPTLTSSGGASKLPDPRSLNTTFLLKRLAHRQFAVSGLLRQHLLANGLISCCRKTRRTLGRSWNGASYRISSCKVATERRCWSIAWCCGRGCRPC